jgi:hypothetical protein
MSVTYITDEDITDKLWDEYEAGWPVMPGFTEWLRDVRIPYAVTIKTVHSGDINGFTYGCSIRFKEEKDLTYFLLTI